MIIKKGGRDPQVIYYNGYYYYCFGRMYVVKAKTVAELATAEPVKVFDFVPGTPYSQEIWAPELHIIDGKCYIYVACDDGNNHHHRMYVLYNDSADPQAPYKMYGKIADSTDKWAIDATILKHNDKMYMIWSGWEGDINVCQNLYIAEMSDPFTICSERVMISTPELEWERHGSTGEEESPFINEGPYALKHNDKLYIVYSASGCWCNDYCLGMLELVGSDPLSASAWKKHPLPVFSKTDDVKGPGHASFITNGPEGDYMFYHAFDEDAKFGGASASAIAQKFTWDGDFPVFGIPSRG